jgi:hypothetical protein
MMQAVALVFDHISIDSAEQQPPVASPGSDASADTSSGSANAALKLLDDLCLMASGASRLCDVMSGPGTTCMSKAASTSPQDLNHTCLTCRNAGTACAWLRSPILPKSFVLELLDFVLGANARTFQTVAIFEHALLSRVRTRPRTISLAHPTLTLERSSM